MLFFSLKHLKVLIYLTSHLYIGPKYIGTIFNNGIKIKTTAKISGF